MTSRTLLSSVLLLSCASVPPVAKSAKAPRPVPPASTAKLVLRAAPENPPLSPREATLKRELTRDVAYLASEVGERHAKRHWELASAADWIANEFEGAGLSVARLGVDTPGDSIAMDIEATHPGRERSREVVVLSAHYDSEPGSPGADDNATGVAALLALARVLQGTHPSRTLRLAATAREGSRAYAERLGARGDAVFAILSLSALGYYSEQLSSQRCPTGLDSDCPRTGDFVAVIAGDRSGSILDLVTRTLGQQSSLPVRSFVVSESSRREFGAGSWTYYDLGFPSVTVTDTGPLRHPHYHDAGDTVEALDFDRLARVVAGLEHVAQELGGRDDGLEPPAHLERPEPQRLPEIRPWLRPESD